MNNKKMQSGLKHVLKKSDISLKAGKKGLHPKTSKLKIASKPAASTAHGKKSAVVRKEKAAKAEANASARTAAIAENILKQNLADARNIIANDTFHEYISKNVGSRANDILIELSYGPSVDEKMAEKLNIKLNEARRMLNLLNNYGIIRYLVDKDKKGWLTFRWYIDSGSVTEFNKKITSISEHAVPALPKNCNDFFICEVCYPSQHIIFPFDVAFESDFLCECGKSLKMLTREEAESVAVQNR